MTNANSAARGLLIYGMILPLALVVGYLMATPTDMASAGAVGLLLLALSTPLLLKFHQLILFLSWNMGVTIFVLPGSPSLWILMAFGSLIIYVGQRALDREKRFISAPSLFWPILFLAVVVIVTANLSGGFGMRVLGSGLVGGKRYLTMLAAIAGYFAMLGCRIPPGKAKFFTKLFFLGAFTYVFSSLIPYGPKELYPLALFFPVSGMEASAVDQLGAPAGFSGSIARFSSLMFAAEGALCYLLARYGIRNLLDGSRPWRFGLVLVCLALGALGGFRSFILLMLWAFLLVFLFEGLLKTRYTGILLLGLILVASLLLPFTRYLPLSLQRSLSVLPLDIDPMVKYDAEYSNEWRVKMWTAVLPEIPRYFWLGKGLSIDMQELELTAELEQRYMVSSQDAAILAGDYHSGPLTVIIPFGIWGVLAWLWLITAGMRALYLNYRYGEPDLKHTNTLIFAFFVAKTLLFIIVFGNFYADLPQFLGLLGFSVSLNHGIRSAYRVSETATEKTLEMESVGEPVSAV